MGVNRRNLSDERKTRLLTVAWCPVPTPKFFLLALCNVEKKIRRVSWDCIKHGSPLDPGSALHRAGHSLATSPLLPDSLFLLHFFHSQFYLSIQFMDIRIQNVPATCRGSGIARGNSACKADETNQDAQRPDSAARCVCSLRPTSVLGASPTSKDSHVRSAVDFVDETRN